MEHVICDIRLGFISVCDKGHLRKKTEVFKRPYLNGMGIVECYYISKRMNWGV